VGMTREWLLSQCSLSANYEFYLMKTQKFLCKGLSQKQELLQALSTFSQRRRKLNHFFQKAQKLSLNKPKILFKDFAALFLFIVKADCKRALCIAIVKAKKLNAWIKTLKKNDVRIFFAQPEAKPI